MWFNISYTPILLIPTHISSSAFPIFFTPSATPTYSRMIHTTHIYYQWINSEYFHRNGLNSYTPIAANYHTFYSILSHVLVSMTNICEVVRTIYLDQEVIEIDKRKEKKRGAEINSSFRPRGLKISRSPKQK